MTTPSILSSVFRAQKMLNVSRHGAADARMLLQEMHSKSKLTTDDIAAVCELYPLPSDVRTLQLEILQRILSDQSVGQTVNRKLIYRRHVCRELDFSDSTLCR